MALLAPKLRDLSKWNQEKNAETETRNCVVWEISVPAKHSLPWSLVLSILLSDSNENLLCVLKKITGNKSEINEITKKLKLNEIDPNKIKKRLGSFNPFKNKHLFFSYAKELRDIVRIFDLRLKRYAGMLSSKDVIYNDDLKLKAASKLLECGIKVFFPENIQNQNFISFPEKFNKNIIIFQYENQIHGLRKDAINIFHFALSTERAHGLKLDALKYFLEKAEISSTSIGIVKQLMDNSDFHGESFLPTIIQSNCIDILPEIYRSPYIAFKLSEAGFQTDPIICHRENPSSLFYAACNANSKYLRILYDYASNCRCLFDKSDRSVRKADDSILETLSRIKSVLRSDFLKLKNENSSFEKHVLEEGLHILEQLKKFAAYQYEMSSALKSFKVKCDTKSQMCQIRKDIIVTTLEHYLKFFTYESKKSPDSLYSNSIDYLKHNEYYECTDRFTFVTFFDNFYKLKLCCGLKEENLFLSIEWQMFLAMMSSGYFPKYVHEVECKDPHDKTSCEKNKNVLRNIPLFYRNTVKHEAEEFLLKLKTTSSVEEMRILFRDEKSKDVHSLPQVIDELFISRLKKYMDAVLEVSPRNDGIKAVLVLVRALQVIGESIKPPRSENSTASFLLRSCLPLSLQKQLVLIRNDLSKYRSNSVYGRLLLEDDIIFMEKIKEELEGIQKKFEVVYFTHYLRIEETVIHECYDSIKEHLTPDEAEMFERACELRFLHKMQEYEIHHKNSFHLLFSLFSDLRERVEDNIEMHHLVGHLKSTEYLLRLIQKYNSGKYLENFLCDVEEFLVNTDNFMLIKEKENNDKLLQAEINTRKKEQVRTYMSPHLQEFLKSSLDSFLTKWRPSEHSLFKSSTLLTPNIQSLFQYLKKNIFLEEEIQEIKKAIKNALQEAKEAKKELENIFSNELYETNHNINELLKRILIRNDKIAHLIDCFKNKTATVAIKYLDQINTSNDSIMDELNKMLEENSASNGYAYTLLSKITFQRYLDNKFYSSAVLPDKICQKLEDFLMKKVNFHISRIKAMKHILIGEDEEIKDLSIWGRSEPIKYHLKFLMRQRYIRESSVCASLEMAFFDCVNIFHESDNEVEWEMDMTTEPSKALRKLYKKTTDLFDGIDLRNLVAHRTNIPEVIGEILDEDDFPSEMIEKVCEFISDVEAIETMSDIFLSSGALTEKDFVSKTEVSNSSKVLDCNSWKGYLVLFPFIKTL